ncbi:6-phosphogluconolactonase [Terriglobus roseus]|uniref:Glucosamine-6-phosphate deaminase n=1 Tax=Terriglobus roseus TaxID=392734 RepID=A0A1H4M4S4_9BACT|nr:6-phosphogluconolactonase [Terriglobus roseus]SEB78070.1 glucosamine-6-phosphate deaminase [Terriglobus roseus]
MTVITPVRQPVLHVSATAQEMGRLAASDVAGELRARLRAQPVVRVVFAAAPSQSEMLRTLAQAEGIDWDRVEAFHMDEYTGLPADAPQRFGAWLTREFFGKVKLHAVHLIDPGIDAERCSEEYAWLMSQHPIDIVCLGIGMNGHIAFNDPPADFNEPQDVRVVELDRLSRVQQVEEGLFPNLEDVPTHAVTLSIPRLLRADKLFCCVPGKLKEAAVTRAFTGEVDPSCPASILRTHAGCTVYLDAESAAGLSQR